MTPHEYWLLYDFKVQQNEAKTNSGVKPMTHAEFRALEQELGDGRR